MKIFHKISTTIVSVMVTILCFTGPMSASAASAPTLGAAASYAVFGKAGVTNDSNVGLTHIWGNVGADLLANITFLDDATQVDGAINVGVGVEAAILTAYGQLAAVPDIPVVLNLAGNNTVVPGVYNVGATTLNGILTLSGAGVYIFRSSSSIAVTPGVGAEVKLTNGADACNVFWQIPASMTIGAGAKIIGTIIADTALISLGTNATLRGRALSRIAQVTLLGNQITEPTCAPVLATLNVIKQVVNTGGGTAVPSDFILHVKNTGSGVDLSTSGTGSPGTSYALTGATYTVSEIANTSYSQIFSGDCSLTGSITLSAGQNKTCTITNTYIPPIVSSGGGGGGSLSIDSCPNGDYSYSYYDGICGIAPVVTVTGSSIISVVASTGSVITPVIVHEIVPIPILTSNIIPVTVKLPNTGISSEEEKTSWNMMVLAVILGIASLIGIVIQRKYKV